MKNRELALFLNWLLKHYSTTNDGQFFGWEDSMGNQVTIESIVNHYKAFQVPKQDYSLISHERIELTYEERVRWFVNNYYETGMEYASMLESMKNEDLDNFEWYGEKIQIPKFYSGNETLYTEEQVREAINLARVKTDKEYYAKPMLRYSPDEIIQSLKQPKKDQL